MTDTPLRALITNVETPLGAALTQVLLQDPRLELAIGWHSQPLAADDDRDPRLRHGRLDMHHDRELWRALFEAAREHQVNCVIHDPISLVTAHRPALDWAKAGETSRRLLLHCREHPSIAHFVLRSSLEVYRVAPDLPSLIDEEHPLDTASRSERVRSLVDTDAYACSRALEAGPQVTVVRCAEVLARGVGSELFEYLCDPLCLRPLGFNPMLNVLSVRDAARALASAALGAGRGVFNAPGKDVLPLSRLIRKAGRRALPVPRELLGRAPQGAIPDGRRMARQLGYLPEHAVDFEQLARDVRRRIPAALQPILERSRGGR